MNSRYDQYWRYRTGECDICGESTEQFEEGWVLELEDLDAPFFVCPSCIDWHVVLHDSEIQAEIRRWAYWPGAAEALPFRTISLIVDDKVIRQWSSRWEEDWATQYACALLDSVLLTGSIQTK